MKHSVRITLYLLLLFLASQVIGLAIIDQYIDHKKTLVTGEVTFTELPYNIERPPSQDYGTTLYIILGVIIGTILLLIIIKYRQRIVWKAWFFGAVVICLSIAFYKYILIAIPSSQSALAATFVLAATLGYFKVFKPNLWVHNLTEVFIYGGIAAVFVPLLNVPSVIVLMLVISAYDIIAVWYSKHMVTMAEFQKGSHVFAGVMLPTTPQGAARAAHAQPKKASSVPHTTAKTRAAGAAKKAPDMPGGYAILGGGDMAFPLLFAGVVMKGLMLQHTVLGGFFLSLLVSLGAATALGLLFYFAQKDKYYPAMPFVTLGCLLGWLAVLLF